MDIEVARTDLEDVRVVDVPSPELADGQARIRVDRFALTANNITYAVFGEAMRYWEFFPVAGDDDHRWGRIPVWGFGDVVESRSPDLAVGERLYGYLPMSTDLVITVGRADPRNVSDVAEHRSAMASAYSRYVRCADDPLYRAEREDLQMLLFPLFFTSFVIEDYLADNQRFGSDQTVVSSASSKTAIGLAHLAHEAGGRMVGLTSPANLPFVEALGVYDQVLPYAQVGQIDTTPSVFVDIAGNRDVVQAVHRHLADHLEHSLVVGGTHWDHRAEGPDEPLPGPAPQFFFAPTQISKRAKEWGREELDRRTGAAWDRFAGWASGWIQLVDARGAPAVVDVYHELLAGHADPRTGSICSMHS